MGVQAIRSHLEGADCVLRDAIWIHYCHFYLSAYPGLLTSGGQPSVALFPVLLHYLERRQFLHRGRLDGSHVGTLTRP